MTFTAEPTGIEGIVLLGSERNDGEGNRYRVSFSLILDAKDPEEASQRATQFRDIVAGDPGDDRRPQHDLGFYWHLHDHAAC